jgi:lysophospholipase L1-like esterase
VAPDRAAVERAPRAVAGAPSRARAARLEAKPLGRRTQGLKGQARAQATALVRPRVPRRAPARPEDESAPTDKRRRASAGRILAVGLLCFFVWLLFDANQLYHSAETGQIGVRRTVAVAILRPIAAFSNALRISGPVNSADSALGRCGIGGAPVCGNTGTGPVTTTIPSTTTVPTTTLPPVVVVSRGARGYLGFLAAPHLGGPPWAPPVPPWPPEIPPPTARHPVVLLSIGDSIGEDLGYGLGDVFSTDPYVRVIQEGVEDTGLARSDYYNWPATLAVYLRRYHPQIVVVMMGANDAQSFYVKGSTYIGFAMPPSADPVWWHSYAARVALVMQEATNAGAHVMWVGLPPMGPASTVPRGFPSQVSKVFYSEAVAHQGVVYFSSAKVLSKKGAWTEDMTIGGSLEQIRSTDGVHLLQPGYDLLAKDLIAPMEQAWNVNLRVG